MAVREEYHKERNGLCLAQASGKRIVGSCIGGRLEGGSDGEVKVILNLPPPLETLTIGP